MIIPTHRRQRGTAMLVVMTLLAVMSVLIGVGSHSLFLLKRELKLIEQRQVEHHAKSPAR
jgi:type II secretory pathway component PulK